MGLFTSKKKKQELAEKARKEKEELERKEKDKAKCEAYYEKYKLETSATMGKIGTYEKTTKENGDEVEKVYTNYGPLSKRKAVRERGGFEDHYTVYEGYLNPDDTNGKSGYFRIVHRIHYKPDIDMRSNDVYQDYNGYHRDIEGNVETFMEEHETSYHHGHWGEICKIVNKAIEDAREKDDTESEME